VHDIEEQESTAAQPLMARVRTFLEDSRFRPRIVDREPRAMPGYTRLRFPADGGPPQEIAK
jgi:hypothetical protein